eukprot:10655261-Ditylum_brightwellii.AAC.1
MNNGEGLDRIPLVENCIKWFEPPEEYAAIDTARLVGDQSTAVSRPHSPPIPSQPSLMTYT